MQAQTARSRIQNDDACKRIRQGHKESITFLGNWPQLCVHDDAAESCVHPRCDIDVRSPPGAQMSQGSDWGQPQGQ
eukprot:8125147-Pyramimonas_sp.AAC.1